ncbi:MAG: glycosyltransferase [Acidimicrobiia bacterium]|nr:glycosyltransferase [Acidimicrobiia bacterium]
MTRSVSASVIVPTFNGAAYLGECLDSIAAQDLPGLEVLVNDDGSTDATVEIARSYSERIENLRVERNPQRLGAVGNVNRCVHLARGRWVKPVFQDDSIEPGCLTTMLAARRRGVPVVVGGRTYRFESDVPEWQRQACDALVEQSLTTRFGSGFVGAEQVADVAAEHAAARLPQLNFVGEPVAVLFERRAALRAGGFDTRFAQLWDYELFVRLAMRRGLVLVDEPVASFRVHGGSETARNLSGSTFATDVVDRLTLLVAYATARPYRPVRTAAARRTPPLDLTALAVGSSWAARRVATDLPVSDQDEAASTLDALAAALPTTFPQPWVGAYPATKYAVELLHELADDVDTAVLDLYVEEPLAVDLASPPGIVAPNGSSATPDPAAESPPEAARSPSVVRSVTRASTALRTNQWWNHMLGPITAFACLQIGWRQIAPVDAFPRVLALLWAAMALAAYAYVINDAADVDADLEVGKSNSMANLTMPARVGAAVAFAALGALPWLFVHLDAAAMAVLVAIYLLPLAYSPRPLRLKEHPLLGPVCDACNAFVLPALFSVALFSSVGAAGGPSWWMIGGAVAWAGGFGLRAILIHQVSDAANDRATGITTLATTIGEVRVARLMRRILFPLELLGLTLLTVTVATWAPWLVAGAAAYLVAFHTARLTRVIDRTVATTAIDQGWLLAWTQIWPALLLSAALTLDDPRYGALVGLVVLLFWPRLRAGLERLVGTVANERLRWAARRSARAG